MNTTIADDVAAIGRLDVIPKILEVARRTTGMGFAAVARVTDDRWVACAVATRSSSATAPVRVRGETRNGLFELSISNAEEPIPSATLSRLYPFTRAMARPMQEGVGLGLYIASKIARGPRWAAERAMG